MGIRTYNTNQNQSDKFSKEYRFAIESVNTLRAKHPKEFLFFAAEVEQYADCVRIIMDEKKARAS